MSVWNLTETRYIGRPLFWVMAACLTCMVVRAEAKGEGVRPTWSRYWGALRSLRCCSVFQRTRMHFDDPCHPCLGWCINTDGEVWQ